MNKGLLPNWILQDVEENKDSFLVDVKERGGSYEALAEDIQILSRGQANLPESLPSTPRRMIQRLRSHFKGNVTLISRVFNYHFPDKYVFYRVSKLEEEIFEAFDFFSSVVPVNEKELEAAVRQGKSYALMLGLPGFVVASPEGIWIYSLNRIQEKLEKNVPVDELAAREKEVRSLLLSLRAS